MRRILAAAVLVGVGLLVLGGYAFQDLLAPALTLVFDWGVILLGAALLIGIGYLLRRHFTNLLTGEKSSAMSAITLMAFFFTLISGLILSTKNEFFSDLVLNIQIPVEASLLAVLAVTLFYASLRLIRTRGWTPLSMGFLLSAVISLVLESGVLPIASGSPAAQVVAVLRQLPLAGARGILIGMALGGLLVGLRVLLTLDRPYGEE
ncbi:MAG: hypothetical protein ACOCYU_02525 [Brevefilum sp.]